MLKYLTTILFVLMILLIGQTMAQNATQILQKSEEIRRGVQSSQAQMSMTIIRPTWQRTMSLKAWSKGEDYALMLVTAPARDKGTATLKRDKEVWTYVPRIERPTKLPPSMMSEGWNGSDFTNEDLVREVSIVSDYTNRVLQDSTIEGRICWKIELIPNEEAAVVWGKVIMFIDQQDYLQLRSEFYDEDGYLVNILNASGIMQMGGRTFAAKLEMIPVEDEGHKTVLEYQNIIFDKKLSESFFSKANMSRVR
ncbi:MAG: outer membrane lipoprotein-sorting protein [Bacteroidota bacterium]